MSERYTKSLDYLTEEDRVTLHDKDGVQGSFLMNRFPRTPLDPHPCGKPLEMAMLLMLRVVHKQWTATPAGRPWFTEQLSQHCLMYLLSLHIRLRAPFYSGFLPRITRTDNSFLLPAHVRCDNQLVHVGNTTTVWQLDVSIDTEELMTCHLTHVQVDPETRKPRSYNHVLPKTPTLHNPPRAIIESSRPADDVITDELRTTDDHTDENGHVTFAVYVTAFMRCLERALHARALPGLGDVHPDDLYVTDVMLMHHGEAQSGGTMMTSVWVNTGEPGVVYGTVKMNNLLLTSCKVVTINCDRNKPQTLTHKL